MNLPPTSEMQHSPASDAGWSPTPYPRNELLLPELRRMLRTRSRVIVGCVLAGVLTALLYVAIRRPVYESAASIEVSPAGSHSMGLEDVSSKLLSPSDPTLQLQSAVTVLRSNTVALAVLQQTKLAERRDFAGGWTQPPGSDVAGASPETRDQLLLRFQKSLTVEIVPRTDIIEVRFGAHDPKLAAEVVNAVVSSYAERNFRSSYDSASQVSTWLSAQIADLKVNANQAQEKLAALQKKRGLVGGDEADNIITEKLKDLNEQLTAAEADRIVKEARYRIAGSGNPELIASAVPEPTLQVLRAQQAQLRVDHARLSTKFGDGYPKLAELGSQMSQVDSAIDAELKNLTARYKNEYLASAGAEKMLRAKFEEQKQKAFDLTEGAAQYAILQHEVQSSQELYQTLQLKLKQAGIVAGLTSANIGVVEAGQAPSEPVSPRPAFDLAMGLGGGMLFGLLGAVGLETLDASIRTGEEAETVTALPILAEIPEVADRRHHLYRRRIPGREISAELRLITHRQPQSDIAESYRRLRTSLRFGDSVGAPQVLAVTSCLPSEGKTFTAINYAVALAQQGAKVLLVDADLREPSVHAAFELAQTPGLTELLTKTWDGEAMFASEVLPNLAVLAAGTSCWCPAELLASPEVTKLLVHLRPLYDHIVFDTPPTSMFTDAVLVAAHADAVLLVARSGVTTKHALRNACTSLNRANVNIAGLVLNGIDTKYERSYYHPYGQTSSRGPANSLDS